MPLTRNQQAALQAHPHQQSSSSSSSLSSRLRGGSGLEDGSSRSLDSALRRAEALASSRNQIHHDMTKIQGSPQDAQLSQYDLHSLQGFGSPPSAPGPACDVSRTHSRLTSTLDQGVSLQGSTDWSSFANTTSITDQMYQDNHQITSQHASPFYSIQETAQREQEAASSQQAAFIDSFGGGMNHDNLMAWKQQDDDRRAGQVIGNVDMASPFTTPASAMGSQQPQHHHSRSFSNEGLAIAQKRLEAVQASGTLAMDLQRLGTSSLSTNLPPSPTEAMGNPISTQESMRTFHHHSQAGKDGLLRQGLLRVNSSGSAPMDSTNLMDHFEAKRRIISQSSSSLRSPSPSDRSVSSTALFGNMSPHTSISTMRHGGDSSVDTSIDSISNSVTSMSANPSRCSSTSDELMSVDGSSRKSMKGKTRLRNIDRKLICEAARDDPKIRQEDLAARFGIERSTVSKTLKNKDKWLVVEEESEGAMIIKHRSGKFPELEATLADWARSQIAEGHAVLDMALRHRALEIAKEAGLGVDTFKASVGWIEKFRDRHDLLKGSHTTQPAARSEKKAAAGTDRRLSPSSSLVVETGVQAAGTGAGEVKTAVTYSPRETVLRSQTSSSSMSNEEVCLPTTQETPKAAKRHYDDMDPNMPMSSSIDSGMASLHFAQQRLSQEGVQDQELTSPSTGTSKRRKGCRVAASQPIQPPMVPTVGSRSWTSSFPRRDSHSVSPPVSAAAPSVMAQRASEHPSSYHSYAPDSKNARARGELASPALQSPIHEQSVELPTATMTAAPLSLVGFRDDRRVTLQEARESLDLVLAFIARQPANLSPNDYFVLGNLQGTLSALAGQADVQHQSHSQQQQQQQHHQQSQQQQLHSPVHLTMVTSPHELYHNDQQRQHSRRLRP